jgi:hypothetical protein
VSCTASGEYSPLWFDEPVYRCSHHYVQAELAASRWDSVSETVVALYFGFASVLCEVGMLILQRLIVASIPWY